MAKLQMQRVYLCALKKDKKDVLETLQRLEMLEVREFDVQDYQENAENEMIEEADSDGVLLKDRIRYNIEYAKEALDILYDMSDGKLADPFFLKGRKQVEQKVYDDYIPNQYSDDLKIVKGIVSNNYNLKERRSEIAQYNAKLESLEPWEKLNIPLDFKGTKSTGFMMGTLPNSLSKIEIETMISDKLRENGEDPSIIPFSVEVVSTLDVLTYFTLIFMSKDEEKVVEAVRKSGYAPPIIDGDKTVSEIKLETQKLLEASKENLKKYEQNIIDDFDKLENVRFFLDFEQLRLDSYTTAGKLIHSEKVFVLNGYIPKIYAEELENTLKEKYTVEVQFEDVDESNEDVPVLLQNNGYASPLEGVIESYALPSCDDVDPTFAISIFYYFMFGMMLSDAGYGLVIFAASVGSLIIFKDTLEIGWRKTLRMYTFAGAFTIFWGVMFGSYFGDLIDTVAVNFFGVKLAQHQSLAPPLWFNPVEKPMKLLTFALIIGIVHLFVGMFLKAVQLNKKKDYKALFSEVIVWYGILIGCILLLVSTEMLGSIFSYDHTVIPPFVTVVGKYLAMVSAVAIILTNGSGGNFGIKIAQGLYSLYGISGYLSDVLSYSRLLALGLATGVIASVINMMGAMVAKGIGGVFGAIVFIIIMIFGHAFNLAINALGAYVHTNRLQYVELFGKFYEGGGLKFSPLKMNTKYYKFKESRKNG